MSKTTDFDFSPTTLPHEPTALTIAEDLLRNARMKILEYRIDERYKQRKLARAEGAKEKDPILVQVGQVQDALRKMRDLEMFYAEVVQEEREKETKEQNV